MNIEAKFIQLYYLIPSGTVISAVSMETQFAPARGNKPVELTLKVEIMDMKNPQPRSVVGYIVERHFMAFH